MAPARKFSCLSMPFFANSGTVKSRRNRVDDLVVLLRFPAGLAENVPKPISARKTPARTINRPIKTRRLKKADCEVDFFFIDVEH